jgi:2-methylcitrate dehydratase PrpD
MANNQNVKMTSRGKVVCTEEGCFFVNEGEEAPVAAPAADKKTSDHEDATFAFARMVRNQKFEDIPADAVKATQMDILDTLATILAGSSYSGTKELVELMTYWGGRAESSIFIHGGKVPAPAAALVNGHIAHARDYDDIYHVARIHVGAVNVPAGFAVAEKVGGVTGKELIAAICMGIEIELRMGQAALLWTQFHPTATFGYFGACATSGRLLGLSEEQLINAFGIAYAQAGGNKQCMFDGSLTKKLQPGLAARGGVLAAHLARTGYTGTRNNLEGKAGFFNLYHGGQYDPEPLTRDLGKRFDVARLGFKPYPCAV